MLDFVRIFLSAVPCIVSFWCFFILALKWPVLIKTQRTIALMFLNITVSSTYLFLFMLPSFHTYYRLDWFLTGISAFAPATYYLYICRLTGTGTFRTKYAAFLLPSVLVFVSLLFDMIMGEDSAREFLSQVKFGGAQDPGGLPLLWKLKHGFFNYVFKPVLCFQIIMIIVATYGRIGHYHSEVKDFFADGERHTFAITRGLRISGTILFVSLCVAYAISYTELAPDLAYIIIIDVLLVFSMIMVTGYTLRQKLDSELLRIMAEETKNMGRAVKVRSDLKERLLQCVEDEFYTNPDVTVMSLSEKLDTNRTYLGETIHEMYGMSFSDFVNDLRIKKAVRHMREIPLNTPLTKVAIMCGYTSYSQFARNFEEFAHLTPSEWMKRYR